MARLIDADDLLKKAEMREHKLNGLRSAVHMCIAKWDVENAPTIDAEPVRHAEWTDTGIEELDLIYSGYKCSQCGFILCGDHTKYCPGCGSKMDKKSPENHKKYQEEETNKKSFK